MAIASPITETADHPLPIDQVVWQDPERMSGAPCFARSRVPITILFEYLEAGDSIQTFLDEFPGVTYYQAVGALYYGKQALLGEHSRR